MTNVDLSREALARFLDFAEGRGLLKKSTAANRRRAATTILAVLDEGESADLSAVDLDDVIRRHRVLAAGSIAPSSLRGHESHLRGAVRDFLDYSRNPSSWRSGRQRGTVPKKRDVVSKKDRGGLSSDTAQATRGGQGHQDYPPVHIDLQIHIFPEATPEQIDQIFASIRHHLYGNVPGKRPIDG